MGIFSLSFLVLFGIPIKTYAANSVILDATSDGTYTTLTPTGQTDLTSALSGHSGNYYWAGSYTYPYDNVPKTGIPADWSWSGGYNGTFSTPGGISILNSDIPAPSGAYIPGHPDLYMCLSVLNSGTFHWLGDDYGIPDQCIHFYWTGSKYEGQPSSTGGSSTRIDTVTPPSDLPPWPGARATSTSFAFESTGFVTNDDYTTDTKVHINYYRQTNQSAVGVGFSPLLSSVDLYFPLSGSGSYSVSTTTNMQDIGVYWMRTTIEKPQFTLFGVDFFTETLVSTSTQFLVATSTGIDNLFQAQIGVIQPVLDQGSNCDFDITAWVFVDMLTCALVPSPGSIALTLDTTVNQILLRAPWGYATKAIQDFSTTSTSTLPGIAFTIQTGPVAGKTIDFTPWTAIANAVSMTATSTPGHTTTVLADFEKYWNILWTLAFVFWLLREIVGFNTNLHASETERYKRQFDKLPKNKTDDREKLAEWEYKHRRL